MKNISSMDYQMAMVRAAGNSGKTSSVNAKEDNKDSFSQMMADKAASSDSVEKPETKTPETEKPGEEKKPVEKPDKDSEDAGAEKNRTDVCAEQILAMDISQQIQTGNIGEENVLKSSVERAAVVLVSVQPDIKKPEESLQTKTASVLTEGKESGAEKNPEAGILPVGAEDLGQKNGKVSDNHSNTQAKTLKQTDGQQNTPESLTSKQSEAESQIQNADTAGVRQSAQNESSAVQDVSAQQSQRKTETAGDTAMQTQEKGSQAETLEKLSGQTGDLKSEKQEPQSAELLQDQPFVKTELKNGTEVVKIKVAEPYRNMDSDAVTQLSAKISDAVKQGKSELNIQLTPENLGKISIKITVLEEGVKIVLGCENQKTMGLLSDRATGIAQIVENNLNQQAVVEIKEDGYWNQQKNATDQHSGQNGKQQEEQNDQNRNNESEDFMQQLRLGLISSEQAV